MSNWYAIGELVRIPQLGARVVATSAGDIAVFRNADDEVYALRDRCPHRGGALSQGIVHGRSVTCPLHNWVVEFESGHARAPDVGCTPTFPVKVENGIVYLDLAAAEHAA